MKKSIALAVAIIALQALPSFAGETEASSKAVVAPPPPPVESLYRDMNGRLMYSAPTPPRARMLVAILEITHGAEAVESITSSPEILVWDWKAQRFEAPVKNPIMM